MAWWSSFLTARRSQRGHVIAEIDFHTAVGGEVLARSMRLDVAVAVRARDREVAEDLALCCFVVVCLRDGVACLFCSPTLWRVVHSLEFRKSHRGTDREHVGGAVEAADEGVARGLRSCGVALVRARPQRRQPALRIRHRRDAPLTQSPQHRLSRKDAIAATMQQTLKTHGHAAVRALGPS